MSCRSLGRRIPSLLPLLLSCWAYAATTELETLDDITLEVANRIPKGGDLHVHAKALLPPKELILLLCAHPNVAILLSGSQRGKLLIVDTVDNLPENAMYLTDALTQRNVTVEELTRLWSVSQAGNPWEQLEECFTKHDALFEDLSLTRDYFISAFRLYLSNRVYHVELRIPIPGNRQAAIEFVETVRSAYYEVRSHTEHFTVRLIGTCTKSRSVDRSKSLQVAKRKLDTTLYLHKTVLDEYFPDHPVPFVVGYDLVNQETTSYPLAMYSTMLAEIREDNPSFHFYLHAGEAGHRASDNLRIAHMLGAKRVGHGSALVHNDTLRSLFRRQQIALEVCPVSNARLGYYPDLTLHPAPAHIHAHHPMVISSDDPAFLETHPLVDDFAAILKHWPLTLDTLKWVCNNSIHYSALDEYNKELLYEHWQREWADAEPSLKALMARLAQIREETDYAQFVDEEEEHKDSLSEHTHQTTVVQTEQTLTSERAASNAAEAHNLASPPAARERSVALLSSVVNTDPNARGAVAEEGELAEAEKLRPHPPHHTRTHTPSHLNSHTHSHTPQHRTSSPRVPVLLYPLPPDITKIPIVS